MLERLLSPAGRALIERAGAGDPLVVGTALRREGHPPDLVAAAATQAALRRRAAGRFTRADAMLFTRDGLEQSSTEAAARLRAARLFPEGPAADLCCGIGGDLLALAATAPVVLAVDRDPVHLRLALANATAYGVADHVRAHCGDVRAAPLDGVVAAVVDPARRAGGHRLRAGESEPPLSWCLTLAERVPALAVKVAPGVDRARVPAGWEVEFVALGRDLLEAVLWSPARAAGPARATVLPSGESLLPQPGVQAPLGEPGGWLVDPSPAVTRAGAVADLAVRLGARQLDPQIAFLALDGPRRTPFGRLLRVERSQPWDQRALARLLPTLDVGAVDLRRRGLAGEAEAVRRGLRVHRLAGSRRVTLVMTRLRGRPWALVCVDPDEPALG